MTQEEKARAYDEAMERVKAIYYQGSYKPDIAATIAETLQNIFPELKESEDERIRKELLDFCKNRAENYPNDPKYKNISAWIAWLEKQGEKPTDEEMKEVLHTEYEKGRADAFAELNQKPFDYSNANIQQKDYAEQKSAEEYNITGIGSKHAEGKLGKMIKKLKHENADLRKESEICSPYSTNITKYYIICPVCGCEVNANWIIKKGEKV